MPPHAPKKRKLPAPLAKRAAAEVAGKRARVKQQALDDVALVQRRKSDIAESFYDMGEALVRLKDPAAIRELDCKGFAEVCEKRLGMSQTRAEQLIDIVRRVRRTDAIRIGQDRVAALLELVDATPEDDTPAQLEVADLVLPSKKVLHVRTASVREIRAAAKAIRAAHAKGKRGRGRTTLPAERLVATALEARLRALGLDRARVTAVATKPGKGSDIRIEHVPIAERAKLGGVFAAAQRAARRAK